MLQGLISYQIFSRPTQFFFKLYKCWVTKKIIFKENIADAVLLV